jgi:hypothetical protein
MIDRSLVSVVVILGFFFHFTMQDRNATTIAHVSVDKCRRIRVDRDEVFFDIPTGLRIEYLSEV